MPLYLCRAQSAVRCMDYKLSIKYGKNGGTKMAFASIGSSREALYVSQAFSDYAKNARPQETKEDGKGKLIGEFSDTEWDSLLEKVDGFIDEYQENLEEEQKEALEKQQGHKEPSSAKRQTKAQELYEQTVGINGEVKSMQFWNIHAEQAAKKAGDGKVPGVLESASEKISQEAVQRLVGEQKKAPYSYLADDMGQIEYNGVVFQCDYEQNRLCLGDVSNPDDCLSIPLESGGCLVVNRDSIDGLSKAIGMFSPEDINRIMRAIAQDAKIQKMKNQLEDEASGMEVLDKKGDEGHEPEEL